MVISSHRRLPNRGSAGSILIEAAVAVAILTLTVIPFSFLMNQERAACRAAYHRAVAMEVVDGEMEILVAGEWRAYKPGRHAYEVAGRSATNLPPGQFVLSVDDQRLSLEWNPTRNMQGGRVVREVKLP